MNTTDTKLNIVSQNSIFKYSSFSLRKVVNLAGSLRKTVGMKMLRKIQTSRKSDW